jgi:hypothetical protein
VARWSQKARSGALLYPALLQVGVVANLALGLVLLAGLSPAGWSGWLELVAGALCCLIAGWIAASYWSMSYWNRCMARQVATWRRIADTFCSWVEDVPVPADAVRQLKAALEEAVPSPRA